MCQNSNNNVSDIAAYRTTGTAYGKRLAPAAFFRSFQVVAHNLAAVMSSRRHPLAQRSILKDLCRHAMTNTTFRNHGHLCLLFGSAARGEPADDLDLLLLVDAPDYWHVYERQWEAGLALDINIASREWLEYAGLDIEWGYCLCESYVLKASSYELEEKWRKAIIKYRSRTETEKRVCAHISSFEGLITASEKAFRSGRPLLGRLLAHEGIRCVGMAVIERYGMRVFSHRSFISEVRHSCNRADISSRISETVVRALCGSRYNSLQEACSAYTKIRYDLSSVLRSLDCRYDLDYSIDAPRKSRIEALKRLPICDCSRYFENYLRTISSTEWLPSIPDIEAGICSGKQIASTIRTQNIPLGSVPTSGHTDPKTANRIIPTKSRVPGARWIEKKSHRLKVILSTGGCKTPSCVFCSLPQFGRARERVSPPETVRELLRRFHPQHLVLYNDGSLLNPAEVSPVELRATYDVIRDFKVKSLTFESIPRFVTEDRIREAFDRSCVKMLTIGMGYQCVGDYIAMSRLGRPDADSMFDRAIDVVQEAGGAVRLYLLWNYKAVPIDDWSSVLRRSLHWAIGRHVESVTICPYVSRHRSVSPKSQNAASFCLLFTTLRKFKQETQSSIEVSIPKSPSCGAGYEYEYGDCPECVAAVKKYGWSDCQHLVHGCRTRASLMAQSKLAL